MATATPTGKLTKKQKAWASKLPPGKVVPDRRSAQARQGIRDFEVQRERRLRGEPRHRCEQVGPAGPRLDRDAERYRQDACAWPCSPRARTPRPRKAAGADIVGLDDLAAQVKAGQINFDVVVASPDAMRVVGQLGQILGPRGLMPNPKVGTVTPDVANAVKNAKAGQVRYRVDKAGIIHCTIGKASFEVERPEGKPPGADQRPAEGEAGDVEGRVSEAHRHQLDHGSGRGGRSPSLTSAAAT